MEILTKLVQPLIILIGIIHLGFALGEIFFTTAMLEKLFGYTDEFTEKTAPIAKNAGIYNSFIAVGLFWSAFAVDNTFRLRLFFLICVAIAGIFGAMTLPNKDNPTKKNFKTFYLQTIPAIIAILLIWKTVY